MYQQGRPDLIARPSGRLAYHEFVRMLSSTRAEQHEQEQRQGTVLQATSHGGANHMGAVPAPVAEPEPPPPPPPAQAQAGADPAAAARIDRIGGGGARRGWARG